MLVQSTEMHVFTVSHWLLGGEQQEGHGRGRATKRGETMSVLVGDDNLCPDSRDEGSPQ